MPPQLNKILQILREKCINWKITKQKLMIASIIAAFGLGAVTGYVGKSISDDSFSDGGQTTEENQSKKGKKQKKQAVQIVSSLDALCNIYENLIKNGEKDNYMTVWGNYSVSPSRYDRKHIPHKILQVRENEGFLMKLKRGTIFVEYTETDGHYDGQYFAFIGKESGTYSYNGADGARHTIQKYTPLYVTFNGWERRN
ncbi:MAG: hypothetical protein LBC07_03260 [Elusimicrobiota bacterium]|jgi:hypothetical protein|nr:hypothetical protein [Elusimicrobiota bacterium]